MRVITLCHCSMDDRRSYQHLSAAMRGVEVKGADEIRRVNRVLDKLEAIGTKVTRPLKAEDVPDNAEQLRQDGAEPDVEVRWQLRPEGGDLWLDDEEYSDLKRRIGKVAWHPTHVRFIARTLDLVEKAPEKDPATEIAAAKTAAAAPVEAPAPRSVLGEGDPAVPAAAEA